MEGLYASENIALRDLHSVYEALFLRGVTSFEVFLEGLFFAILREKVTYPKKRKVSLRMTAANDKALMEILLQNQAYLQWIPFKHTKGRARMYLTDGKPFTDLAGGDESVIQTVTTIRNAIAHRSTHAKGEFERTVIGSRALLRGERTPSGFLRTAANPAQKRFEMYMIELSRIATKLC